MSTMIKGDLSNTKPQQSVMMCVCQLLEKWAKEAGAICKIGRAVLVDCQALDKYIEAFRLPPE